MPRIIKFRAWDKAEKRMWWNVQDAYDTLGNHDTPDPDLDNNDPFRPVYFGEVLDDDNYIVMQFTGLKDKNGKEVYEGDIVDLKYLEPNIKKYGHVRWDKSNGNWYITHSRFFGITIRYVEVIGNIYENPELLEAQ